MDTSLGFSGLYFFQIPFKYTSSELFGTERETNHEINESIDNSYEWFPKTQDLLQTNLIT